MTITSSGYDGSVNESAWSRLAALVGSKSSVLGQQDLQVTAGVAAMTVRVLPGRAASDGVLVESDAVEVRTLAAIISGTRWDTVVIARNWSGTGGASIIEVRTGGGLPGSATLNTAAGSGISDQPLAYVKVVAGFSAVQDIIDLRHFAGAVLTVATAAALPDPADVLDLMFGQFAIALDTGYQWQLRDPTGLNDPEWVNLDDTDWRTISLPGSRLASGTPPALGKRSGIVCGRGAYRQADGSNFVVGSTYSLGTAPTGFRPGVTVSFTVDHAYMSTTSPVAAARVIVTPAGVITAEVTGPTSSIRLDGVIYPAEN